MGLEVRRQNCSQQMIKLVKACDKWNLTVAPKKSVWLFAVAFQYVFFLLLYFVLYLGK